MFFLKFYFNIVGQTESIKRTFQKRKTPLFIVAAAIVRHIHTIKKRERNALPVLQFVLFQTLISTPQSSGLLLIFAAVSMCYSSSSVFFSFTFTITDSAL